jgi:hypothetical protein
VGAELFGSFCLAEFAGTLLPFDFLPAVRAEGEVRLQGRAAVFAERGGYGGFSPGLFPGKFLLF